MNKLIRLFIPCLVFSIFLFSCTGGNENTQKERPTILLKNNKPKGKLDTVNRSAPIINVSDSISTPFNIIYIKDSAKNNVRLSQKLAKIYSEKLTECIKKNKLKVMGAPIAWYKTQKAPFFFEAGIPVDRKPTMLPKTINYKRVSSGQVMIAHFYGPYEETVQAYQILKQMIKEKKKSPSAAPYEIYVDDPIGKDGNPLDPYKVQTNIVYPFN